jgi:hypothetical protein
MKEKEERKMYMGMKEGSRVPRSKIPDTGGPPIPDGDYFLRVIPISKTDLYKYGRDFFIDRDNYCEHMVTIDAIKANFDSDIRLPVLVKEKRDLYYHVIDGHHRIIACRELGRKYIMAFVKALDEKLTK